MSLLNKCVLPQEHKNTFQSIWDLFWFEVRGRDLILLPPNGCFGCPGAIGDACNNSHIQLAQSTCSDVCGLFLACLVCPETARPPCADPAWHGCFRMAGLWPLGHPCGPGSALRSLSTTLEREMEGCYPSSLPAYRPDLGHPVSPITSLFHPHQLPNGRTGAQKEPRKCQPRERCGELLEGRGGQALAGLFWPGHRRFGGGVAWGDLRGMTA